MFSKAIYLLVETPGSELNALKLEPEDLESELEAFKSELEAHSPVR